MEEMNPRLAIYLCVLFAILISMIALFTIFDHIYDHDNVESEAFFNRRVYYPGAGSDDSQINETDTHTY